VAQVSREAEELGGCRDEMLCEKNEEIKVGDGL
jgi:hypothetical protein